MENHSIIKKLIVINTRPFRYQDVHNKVYVMVMASNRWLGARLDFLASLLVGAVALAAILVSQDAGKLKILSNVLVKNLYSHVITQHELMKNKISMKILALLL